MAFRLLCLKSNTYPYIVTRLQSEPIMYKHKAHPWHGISLGESVPQEVTAFIEIVPTDTVKYEVDKPSGYLSIDRPQQYSNIVPALYGFLPRTYCADQVAELTNRALSRTDIQGDNDPLDICILTEKDVTHGDIIVKARPIGGLRLLDNQQADDKIIAVLKNDLIYENYDDIRQLPEKVIDRLVHYFTTYKDRLPNKHPRMELIEIYEKETAYEVIRRAMEDYTQHIRHQIK